MRYSRVMLWFSRSAVLSILILTACGGTAEDDDSGSTGGNSAASGGGSGDGDGDGGSTSCNVDSDCVAASHTDSACFAPGCELPLAASLAQIEADECLVAWSGTEPPARTDACTPSTSSSPCPAACALPPTCVLPYCDTGSCQLVIQQDGANCEKPKGTGGAPSGNDCEALDTQREAALKIARECLTTGIVAECTAGESVLNECGCEVVINDNQPQKVAAAQAAYDAWNAKCEPPDKCALLDCVSASGSGECSSEDGGDQGTCAWVNP